MVNGGTMMPDAVETLIRSGERLDDLRINGFRLIQRPGSFCLGTDTVLLADFAAPRRRETAADLGCGNGALGILLAAHRTDISVDAIDIAPEACDLAQRNVLLNGIGDRMRIHLGDMRTAESVIAPGTISLAVCNPPYWVRGDSVINEGSVQNTARFEEVLPGELCAGAARILKYGGRFCVVFPASRVFEMMEAMHRNKMEPKRMRTVHPSPDKPPKIILIEAVKGGGHGQMWMPPLVLKDADGSPSSEWHRIYGE